jgi:predicted dehydrogenase
MVGLCLIGFGGYGRTLAELILRNSEKLNCRLVAAAEKLMSQCPKTVERLSGSSVVLYDDAIKMLDDLRGRCDGVYIATGIASHEALAIAAAQRGYHVHVEKPPAATVQEVDRMLEAMEKHQRLCVVGFQAVHSDDVRFLKDRLVSGKLGRVRNITCRTGWPRAVSYLSRNDWAGKLRADDKWVLDGPAMNALAHQITNMLLLASEHPYKLARPTSVRAELYVANPVEAHDTAAVEIRTDAGPTLHFLATLCPQTQYGPIIEANAERGQAVYNYGVETRIAYTDGTEESCPPDKTFGRDKMLAEFVEAIRTGDGSQLRCDLAAGRLMTLAADGAHESSGRIHRIPESFCRLKNPGAKDQTTLIEGIDELMRSASARACLFSDLPDAPRWAVATKPFDLAAYTGFPQQFCC